MPILRQRIPRAPERLSARHLRAQAADRARRARRKLLILAPLLAAVIAGYHWRERLFGLDEPVRIAAAVVLVIVGWAFARQLGNAAGPRVVGSLDPGTAGVAGFVIRLFAIVALIIVALRIAGLQPGTIALGASFTAVVFGLAAQQTFGNILAGIVLLSARPFSVGDRVRFAGFGMDVEGTVAAHGLLYVTMNDGEDLVLVPNNTALTMSVRPIREPAAVDMRARLPQDVDPEEIQERVCDGLSVPTRDTPHVALEEFDGDEVVVRIKAVPEDSAEGGALAREVLRAVTEMAPEERPRDGQPVGV
jgi:small conductance mechanosensitive channel